MQSGKSELELYCQLKSRFIENQIVF